MKGTLLFAALVLMAVVPAVGAHTPNPKANCDVVGDESSATAGPAYLFVSGTTVQAWTESNSWPGLQTHAHTCRLNGVTTTIPADNLVAGTP